MNNPTTLIATTTTTDLSWPADRFYWALLDAPGYRRVGPLPPGLLAALADEVPQPIDEVFAVGIPTGGNRVLVCAAPREALLAIAPAVRALRPSALPPGMDTDSDGGAGDDPGGGGSRAGGGTMIEHLNLLVGEFEPPTIRRQRHRRHRVRAAVVLLVGGLAVIGFSRRSSHWQAVSARAERAHRDLVAQVWGDDAPGMPPQHAAVALDAELDRLRELARSRPTPPSDASVRLVSLLKAWPVNASSKPQSLAVNDAGVTVSVAVEGDPAPFLAAFKPPEGWTMDEPRLNSAGAITRLTLQLRPESPGKIAGDHP